MSFLVPKKPQILYAPMLASFGGGSARGFNPGGGPVGGPGEAVFITTGSHSWTVPDGVTSVSVLSVGAGGSGAFDNAGGAGGGGGLGYKNNYAVTPGATISVFVGGIIRPTSSWESLGTETPDGRGYNGQDSYFVNTGVVKGGGGGGALNTTGGVGGAGGSYAGDGGGAGGAGGSDTSNAGCPGGGGAGGYTGTGGIGAGNPNGGGQNPTAGGGGGGGGGGALAGVSRTVGGGSGGGVGIYGQGSSGGAGTNFADTSGNFWQGGNMSNTGTYNYNWSVAQAAHGLPGSGGVRDQYIAYTGGSYSQYDGVDLAASSGGTYGQGGGGSNDNSPVTFPGKGVVRVVWGDSSISRTFPSTNVDLASSDGNVTTY